MATMCEERGLHRAHYYHTQAIDDDIIYQPKLEMCRTYFLGMVGYFENFLLLL